MTEEMRIKMCEKCSLSIGLYKQDDRLYCRTCLPAVIVAEVARRKGKRGVKARQRYRLFAIIYAHRCGHHPQEIADFFGKPKGYVQ